MQVTITFELHGPDLHRSEKVAGVMVRIEREILLAASNEGLHAVAVTIQHRDMGHAERDRERTRRYGTALEREQLHERQSPAMEGIRSSSMNDDHFNHDAHIQALEEASNQLYTDADGEQPQRRRAMAAACSRAAGIHRQLPNAPWIGPSPVMFPLDEEAE